MRIGASYVSWLRIGRSHRTFLARMVRNARDHR
jgi:hypothetical protein